MVSRCTCLLRLLTFVHFLIQQTKPPLNSSFDDLADDLAGAGLGLPDACPPSPLPPPKRKVGQVTGPSKSGLNYEPVHSESEEMSDMDDQDSPVNKSPPPLIVSRKARVGISFDPKGRASSSKKKKKNKGELDDDTEICL